MALEQSLVPGDRIDMWFALLSTKQQGYVWCPERAVFEHHFHQSPYLSRLYPETDRLSLAGCLLLLHATLARTHIARPDKVEQGAIHTPYSAQAKRAVKVEVASLGMGADSLVSDALAMERPCPGEVRRRTREFNRMVTQGEKIAKRDVDFSHHAGRRTDKLGLLLWLWASRLFGYIPWAWVWGPGPPGKALSQLVVYGLPTTTYIGDIDAETGSPSSPAHTAILPGSLVHGA